MRKATMNNDYKCPYCKGLLNVEQNITFSARKKNGKTGLIMMNPEVGNYDFIKHPTFELKDGEQMEFYCPICHANLSSVELSNKLAKVLLYDHDDQREYDILFSKISGERATYKIKGAKVVPFGDHQSRYINILKFGAQKK